MSILIKNMDMPKPGEYRCIIRHWIPDELTIDLYGAEELCGTLVSVPTPHGRLIDADRLCDGLVSNHPVAIYANNAPTVIEAEEEEI